MALLDGDHDGVYVSRRDTSSRFNAIAGGRLFPGVHHLSHFKDDPSYSVTIVDAANAPVLEVEASHRKKSPAGRKR